MVASQPSTTDTMPSTTTGFLSTSSAVDVGEGVGRGMTTDHQTHTITHTDMNEVLDHIDTFQSTDKAQNYSKATLDDYQGDHEDDDNVADLTMLQFFFIQCDKYFVQNIPIAAIQDLPMFCKCVPFMIF